MNTFLIDYRDIQTPKKGFSGLFNDYSHEGQMHDKLTEKFFHFDYLKEADYYKHLNTLVSKSFRRKELAELLSSARTGGSEPRQNISNRLKKPCRHDACS